MVRDGKRKTRRPLDPKRSLHLVFRSIKARGAQSFLHRRHKGHIHWILLDTAVRFGIKVYRYENVGNHIHLHVRGRSRRALQAFLRVFPQRVMFQVTGARKGRPRGKFFDRIVYSRIVNWGGEFKVLTTYLWKNRLEALGFSRDTITRWRLAAKSVPI